MSKKVLKLAGRRPILLALFVMATLTLGLLFSGWLTPTPGKAQQGKEADPTPSQETTNCVVFSTKTTCSEASVGFTASNPVVCGLPIIVSVNLVTTNGQIVTDTTYTNAGNSGSNACPDTITTTNPAPAIISRTWADSSSTNCGSNSDNNLSASFTPTALSGSVTFTVVWQHVCDKDYATNTTSVPYTVPCPTITNCTVTLQCAPNDDNGNPRIGAQIAYNFNCADGWWTWEVITDANGNPFPGMTLSQATNNINWGNPGDQIYDGGPATTNSIHVTYQTIYFAPVGGGSATNNNSTCSFQNTQTIQVTQTNAVPPHGIITTTVTIGSGITATCNY